MVVTNAVRSTANAGPDASGRWGKSSAPWECSVYSLGPQVSLTAPLPAACSSVTGWVGSARTISSRSRPVSTVDPGSATSAWRAARTESSMSVAASSTSPPASARIRIPERIWTVERCETPRATICKRFSRSSWGQTIFIPSSSSMPQSSLSSLRRRGYRSRGCESCGERRTDRSGSGRAVRRTPGSEPAGSSHPPHRRDRCAGGCAEPTGSTQLSHRPAGERSPGLLDARRELLDDVERLAVLADQARDAVHAVHDRGVVAPAELGADLGKRLVGQLAAQVHRDVARQDDDLRALVAAQVDQAHAVGVADGLLDLLDRDRPAPA